MIRKLPVIPTLIVLAAVGIMLRLGFWQLDRMQQKETMLARYGAAEAMSGAVQWPSQASQNGPPDKNRDEATLYRRSSVACLAVAGTRATAGQNDNGASGYAHVADCILRDGSHAPVVLGWSRDPGGPVWKGGIATGWVAPGPRLVADPPLAGLQPNAKPDPGNIPNNHLAYAVQWFLFAGVALLIYVLALRKRLPR